MTAVLGLDVGGANLKAAHTAGVAKSAPFALWKSPGELPAELGRLVQALPPFDVLAVTMTGELCDCFASKREGVAVILDAVEAVAAGRPVRVWTNEGELVGLSEAHAGPLKVASANWLALATFAGRYVPEGLAFLVDVGSTTSDIIPLRDGRPVPRGRTDPERLASGELVYTGGRRTPICAILGGSEPLAAELFATALDAHLVLGTVGEDGQDTNTADGQPATRACAHARLARMLCADLETSTEEERLALAGRAREAQLAALAGALRRQFQRHQAFCPAAVLAGEGEALALEALRWALGHGPSNLERLQDHLGPEVSRAACAHAVAVLCRERGG